MVKSQWTWDREMQDLSSAAHDTSPLHLSCQVLEGSDVEANFQGGGGVGSRSCRYARDVAELFL